MMVSKRRGACPTLDHPMQTGDGLLARISPLEGSFTPVQLGELARAATQFGNGIVEISTRGNLQIRGLSVDSHANLMRVVESAGIVVNRSVPILAPALFGPRDTTHQDPGPLKGLIAERLEQADFTADLAPKISVIVDAGGLVDVSGLIADVRVVHRQGSSDEWDVFVGGTQKEARLAGIAKGNDAAASAILSALKLIAAGGNKARGADLAKAELTHITPHGIPQVTTVRGAAHEKRCNSLTSLIGLHALPEQKYMVGLALPYGTIHGHSIEIIAQAVQQAGSCPIFPLPRKILAVTQLDERAAQSLLDTAHRHDFVCDEDDPRLKILSCAGAPACSSAYSFFISHQMALTILDLFADELEPVSLIHLSGCEKRCARHGDVELEFVGVDNGIEVTRLGGRETRRLVSDRLIEKMMKKLNSEII